MRAAMGDEPSVREPSPRSQLAAGGKVSANPSVHLSYGLLYADGEYCGSPEEQGPTHPKGALPAEDLGMIPLCHPPVIPSVNNGLVINTR